MPTGITSSPKKQYGFLTNIVQTLDKPGNSKINLQQSVQILNIPLKGSPEKYSKFINESKYEFIKESSINDGVSSNDDECFSDKSVESSSDDEYAIPVNDTDDNKLALHDENLLSLFYDYMTGPNRGCKPNSVSETIRDVRRILIEVSANNDLRIAFDKNLVSVEMKYIHQYCGGFKTNKITKASSIKKYLLSLRSFCQFLLSKDEDHNVDIQPLTKADFQLKQWIRLYAKKNQVVQSSA